MIGKFLIKEASQEVLNQLLSMQGARRGHNRRPGGLGLGYMAQKRQDGSGAAKLRTAARRLHAQGHLTAAEYRTALREIARNCKRK